MRQTVKEGRVLSGGSGQRKAQAKDARVPGTYRRLVTPAVPRSRAKDVSLSGHDEIRGRDGERSATTVVHGDHEMRVQESSHRGHGGLGCSDRKRSITGPRPYASGRTTADARASGRQPLSEHASEHCAKEGLELEPTYRVSSGRASLRLQHHGPSPGCGLDVETGASTPPPPDSPPRGFGPYGRLFQRRSTSAARPRARPHHLPPAAPLAFVYLAEALSAHARGDPVPLRT